MFAHACPKTAGRGYRWPRWPWAQESAAIETDGWLGAHALFTSKLYALHRITTVHHGIGCQAKLNYFQISILSGFRSPQNVQDLEPSLESFLHADLHKTVRHVKHLASYWSLQWSKFFWERGQRSSPFREILSVPHSTPGDVWSFYFHHSFSARSLFLNRLAPQSPMLCVLTRGELVTPWDTCQDVHLLS